jgi:ribonuclease E
MTTTILVDAQHPEDVRLVLTSKGRVEEFDYQNALKKTIKGNCYLARIVRIEPSLQAAFVDYGAEKNGFLPFAEIHPDYYQLPVADKQRLIESMTKARSSNNKQDLPESEEKEEATPVFASNYRIQEVLKCDQVLLVQVEREERGNKGASLTTYINLTGRYSVYMPNALYSGGISRKIESSQDRQRLKELIDELLEKCGGKGGVIIRTAGAEKTKAEIRRDFDYLRKLWDNIRTFTLEAHAPAFIYEEGDIIKKAIRDLYDSNVEEIMIQGEEAYEDARKFMELVLPRHVHKIKHYQESAPIFSKYGINEQIAELYNHEVTLPSGGHIVLTQTEALVSIDVNSGKLTSEKNIEATALKTNLEAAKEIARQLRLRDLSGLVVIDFIDMEDLKNKKVVEKALRGYVSQDRARIQMSLISPFGMLEMSRQRLKQSFMDSHTENCKACSGRGYVRAMSATAVAVLRAIEHEIAIHGASKQINISGAAGTILHILNHKRFEIHQLEKKYDIKVVLSIDDSAGPDGFFLEAAELSNSEARTVKPLSSVDDVILPDEPTATTHRRRFTGKAGGAKATAAKIIEEPMENINTSEPKKGERATAKEKGRTRTHEPKPTQKVADEPKSENTPVSESLPVSDERGRSKRRYKGGNVGNQQHQGGGNRSRHKGRRRSEGSGENKNRDLGDNPVAPIGRPKSEQNQSLLREIWKKIVE